MKKILFMSFLCVLTLGLIGTAFARFSDTETSSGNTLVAGTMDLSLNGGNPFYGTLVHISNIQPGKDLTPIVLNVKNVGTLPGILKFVFTIDGEYDAVVPAGFEFASGNMPADGFASLLYVKAATQDSQNVLPGLITGFDTIGGNGDGKVSLYELASKDLVWTNTVAPFSNVFSPNASSSLSVTLCLGDTLNPWRIGGPIVTDGTVNNRPQADGITLTVTATLGQLP